MISNVTNPVSNVGDRGQFIYTYHIPNISIHKSASLANFRVFVTKPAIIKIHVNKTHGTRCICPRAFDKIKQHSRSNDYPCHPVSNKETRREFPGMILSCWAHQKGISRRHACKRKSPSTVYKQTARTEKGLYQYACISSETRCLTTFPTYLRTIFRDAHVEIVRTTLFFILF